LAVVVIPTFIYIYIYIYKSASPDLLHSPGLLLLVIHVHAIVIGDALELLHDPIHLLVGVTPQSLRVKPLLSQKNHYKKINMGEK